MQTNTWLRNAALALIFAVPFVPFLVFANFFFPFISSKAFVFRILVEIAFALWVVLALRDRTYRPRWSSISKSILLFLVIIGLADIFGVSPVKSFWSNFERMEGYIALLHFGAYYLVASSVLISTKIWKSFWNTTLAASLVMVLYSIFQLAGAIEINQGGVRVDGTLGNATYLAVYMLMHIGIAAFLYAREKKGSAWKAYYALTMLLNALVLYFTATRGAILGLALGILITAGFLIFGSKDNKKIQKRALLVVAILVVLGGLFVAVRNTSFVTNSPVLGRFSNLSLNQIRSQGRFYIWPMAVEGIKERPLLGWGQENFNYTFNAQYNPAMYNQEQWFDRAHNIILDWGIAGGLLGLLSYLGMFVALLYAIWRKSSFSYIERSILTGFVAGYFFQNLFVFDNIASYILFFSLLAYVHFSTSVEGRTVREGEDKLPLPMKYALGVGAVVLVLFTLYSWNLRPIQANTQLIKAFRGSQSTDLQVIGQVQGYLENALTKSTLGRSEVREQIPSLGEKISSSQLDQDKKNEFATFAKNELLAQVNGYPDDARYRIIAGSYLARRGLYEEALVHLRRAIELTPGKQVARFELAEVYFAQNNYQAALAELKTAYELAPAYTEAKIIYLIGAIYAKDDNLARQLLSEIPPEIIVGDDRVARVLMNTGRYDDLIAILGERIKKEPTKLDNYASLVQVYLQMGNKSKAIEVLTVLSQIVPEAKPQADEYIRQIKSGEI